MDLKNLAYDAEKLWIEYAKLEEKASYEEEYKKILIAEVKQRLRGEYPKASDTKLESIVLASEEYKEHIKKMLAMRRESNIALYAARRGDRLWASMQSILSYKKELVKRELA